MENFGTLERVILRVLARVYSLSPTKRPLRKVIALFSRIMVSVSGMERSIESDPQNGVFHCREIYVILVDCYCYSFSDLDSSRFAFIDPSLLVHYPFLKKNLKKNIKIEFFFRISEKFSFNLF